MIANAFFINQNNNNTRKPILLNFFLNHITTFNERRDVDRAKSKETAETLRHFFFKPRKNNNNVIEKS